jgi:hypothetical protein
MQITYGTRYACDGCGDQADIDRPEGIPAARLVPEGWASGFRLEDYHPEHPLKMITDLCPSCAALPIGELLAKVRQTLWAG